MQTFGFRSMTFPFRQVLKQFIKFNQGRLEGANCSTLQITNLMQLYLCSVLEHVRKQEH